MTTANLIFLTQARANLSLFVLKRADRISKQVGFGYRDVANAPETYASLMQAWETSKRTRAPFPVWSGGSDKTIYTSIGANYAFRFWHDSLHALLGLDFTLLDEVTIGHMQADAVAKEFGHGSLEHSLMHFDTVGQSLYADRNSGEFPEDQLAFVVSQIRWNEETAQVAA